MSLIEGKQHVTPFPKESLMEYAKISDLIILDLWGPAWTTRIFGGCYFISFIDVKTRWPVIYFLKGKSSILEHIKAFKVLLDIQKGRKMKALHIDNGTKYVNDEVKQYLLHGEGIQLQPTAPYSLAQNGIAK